MPKRELTQRDLSRYPGFRALCNALASSKTPEEVGEVLQDVGSLQELQAWSDRLEIAKHLSKGKSYRQVAEITGASTTTVTRVASTLKNGTGALGRYLGQERRTEDKAKAEVVEEVGEQKKSAALRKYL